jgi:hypothetical protein
MTRGSTKSVGGRHFGAVALVAGMVAAGLVPAGMAPAGASGALAAPPGNSPSGSLSANNGFRQAYSYALSSLRGPAASQAGCSLPVTYDPYQGFRVGVPSGWEVSTLGGMIEVTKTASGTEGALLYPAALTSGMTPASFFTGYMRYQQQWVAREGVTLTYKLEASSNGLPLASVQLRTSVGELAGFARVMLVPERTQFSSQEAVFSSWWAPPARWATDSAALIGISHCYSPAPAQVFRVFRDQAFTYILPPGWNRFDELQDSIDLRGFNNNADASYLFFGIPAQYNTPQLALDHIFQVTGTTVTAVLSSTRLPSQQLSNGGTQGQEYEEYLGRFQGKAVHGLVYVLTDSGPGETFGVMRLGASTTALWNAVNGGLIEMMGAIQHSFVQDLQEIQRLNQQWQAESAQVANFDDVLNGQQLVQDPNTGQPYLAPYSSYRDGPQGPGYYGPNDQKLVPISH